VHGVNREWVVSLSRQIHKETRAVDRERKRAEKAQRKEADQRAKEARKPKPAPAAPHRPTVNRAAPSPQPSAEPRIEIPAKEADAEMVRRPERDGLNPQQDFLAKGRSMDVSTELVEPAGERDGKRVWKLGGEILDDEQLQAKMEKRHAVANRERELDRELNMLMPLKGFDVHAAAMKDLRGRKIYEPSATEYLEACVRVKP
jgi:hypothetical protein